MDKLVAKTYSEAFFELALELNEIDNYEKQAKYIIESINNDEDFMKIISHPEISKSKKMDILKNIFNSNLSDSFLGLFEVLLNKKRESNIIYVMNEFLDIVAKHKGIVNAEVISSKHLDDTQLNNIKDKLSKKLNKQVVLKVKVDNSLIAGLKINICGQVIDGSIRKQIDDMKNMLYGIKMS